MLGLGLTPCSVLLTSSMLSASPDRLYASLLPIRQTTTHTKCSLTTGHHRSPRSDTKPCSYAIVRHAPAISPPKHANHAANATPVCMPSNSGLSIDTPAPNNVPSVHTAIRPVAPSIEAKPLCSQRTSSQVFRYFPRDATCTEHVQSKQLPTPMSTRIKRQDTTRLWVFGHVWLSEKCPENVVVRTNVSISSDSSDCNGPWTGLGTTVAHLRVKSFNGQSKDTSC